MGEEEKTRDYFLEIGRLTYRVYRAQRLIDAFMAKRGNPTSYRFASEAEGKYIHKVIGIKRACQAKIDLLLKELP